MTARGRTLIGATLALVVAVAWLWTRPMGQAVEGGPPTEFEKRSKAPPSLASVPPQRGAAAPRANATPRLRLHVVDDCGVALDQIGAAWVSGATRVAARVTRVELGRFDVEVEAGNSKLSVDAKGHGDVELLTSSPKAAESDVEVVLTRRTTLLVTIVWPAGWSDRVTDVSVFAGRASSNTARGFRPEGPATYRGTLDGCGRFRVGLNFVAEDHRLTASGEVLVEPGTGESIATQLVATVPAEVAADSERVAWRVRVLDTDGTPIANAGIDALRHRPTYLDTIARGWSTGPDGEARLLLPLGEWSLTIAAQGRATTFLDRRLEGEREDVVRLAPANARLIATISWATPSEPPTTQLRVLDAGSGWPWRPIAYQSGMSGQRFAFRVESGRDHALLVLGRDFAPTAVRIDPIVSGAERRIDVVLETGATVELRGLDAPAAGEPSVLVTYDGILGEMLTATPIARYEHARWWIDHAAAGGGDVEVRQGGRNRRGRLAAVSDSPRVVELR